LIGFLRKEARGSDLRQPLALGPIPYPMILLMTGMMFRRIVTACLTIMLRKYYFIVA
jgi:hypothetical protein